MLLFLLIVYITEVSSINFWRREATVEAWELFQVQTFHQQRCHVGETPHYGNEGWDKLHLRSESHSATVCS